MSDSKKTAPKPAEPPKRPERKKPAPAKKKSTPKPKPSETGIVDEALAVAGEKSAPKKESKPAAPEFVRFLGNSVDGRIRTGDVARRPAAKFLEGGVGWLEITKGQFETDVLRGKSHAKHLEEAAPAAE